MIVIRIFRFLGIIQNLLLSPSFNFTIFGSPGFVTGPTGGFALLLNGLNQYVTLGDQSGSCLGDLELCQFGLTFRFNLKIIKFSQKTYIFTNGGDQAGYYGMAMWHTRNRLYLTCSTKTRVYAVFIPFQMTNTFVRIEFSWSLQTGLGLYFDGKLVSMTTKYYVRQTAILSRQFYMGTSLTMTGFSNIVIEGWDFTEATKDIADSLNATIGNNILLQRLFNVF